MPVIVDGERLRVVTPGTEAASDGRADVIIGRGAFGSGEHETTASCLAILEGLDCVAGASALDLGSGTGVLAIAAVKLGAARVVCVDSDAAAVAAARRFAGLNGVAELVEHVHGELPAAPEGPFDLILANFHGPVMLAVADDLVRRARRSGTLLLSGVLWEDNWEVRRRYRGLGCEVVRNLMLAEYSTILLRR